MESQKCSKCLSTASVQCACQLPPIPLCTPCVGSHLTIDQGSHNITMLPKAGNDICDECGQEPAESVCSCLQPLLKYCVKCKFLHIDKNPSFTHSLLPIQVLKKPFDSTEFEKISEMVRKTNTAKEKLMSNFTLIEVCREEILRKSNQLIEEIQMWKTETLSEIDLIRYKAEQYIGNICSELEKSKFDLNFVSEIGLVNLIRNGAEMLLERNLVFYQYQCSVDSLKTTLKSSFSMTFTEGNINPSSGIGLLAVIKALAKFQLPSCVRAELKVMNSKATNSTALIYKDPETLFVIGANDSNSIFSIDVTSDVVTNYPKMSVFRSYPGVICINNALLVFGGYHDCVDLRSCEKLELTHYKWESLGNMLNTRHGFNPVERDANVYLIGGYHSQGCIETYHLQSGVFQLLRWRLLHDLFTCAFGVNDEIIILNGTCQYSLSHLDQLILISDAQENVDRWSCIQPIRYKEDIYFVRSDKHGVHEMLRWSIQCRAAEKVLDI